MKKFKALAVILALALVIGCFASCAGKPATDETTVADETNAPAANSLTMGSSCDFPPYESVADDGSYEGIDIDIATAVCEKLGVELIVKDMDFNGIIAAVETGAVDFGMSGMTITESRKQSVNFSTPYETAVQAILVKEGSEITGPEDLEGKKIGVQAGTTGDDYCTEDFGAENVNQYTKYALAVQALVNGQVDCVVVDAPVAKEFAAQTEGLKVLDTAYATEEYAVCFSFENTELLDKWNAAYDELVAEGAIDAIYAMYAAEDEAAEETDETVAEDETAEVAETEEAVEETTEEAA